MYKCSNCGKEYTNYVYSCYECSSHNIIQEEKPQARVTMKGKPRGGVKTTAKKPIRRAKSLKDSESVVMRHTPTGISELDRVLGGGFVDNEVILFGAVQGTGKSTLALQMCDCFCAQGKTALYCSSEETFTQIKMRATRLGIEYDNLYVVSTDSLEEVLGYFDELQPDFFIMDSLQTVNSENVTGKTGSLSQANEAAHVLTARIKDAQNGAKGVFINQVTKNEEFAGSNTIQHLVDCVLFFESSHDSPLKFLRAFKNRFGQTHEVGIFQHGPQGLEEVTNPAEVFLDDTDANTVGSVFTVMSEGIRQIPIEVQALVNPSNLPTPRKQFKGVDYNTGQIVSAILDKYCQANLWENDTFVSTVFGVKVTDPLTNLAVAAAILSSSLNKVPKPKTVFLGELTLTGQVRSAFDVAYKVKEAERMGFNRVVLPASAAEHMKGVKNIKITYISSVRDLVEVL